MKRKHLFLFFFVYLIVRWALLSKQFVHHRLSFCLISNITVMFAVEQKELYSAPEVTLVRLAPSKPLAVSDPMETLQEGEEWDWS